MSPEEERTLCPRFNALRGDAARFHLLEGAAAGKPGEEIYRASVTLADVAVLEDAIR